MIKRYILISVLVLIIISGLFKFRNIFIGDNQIDLSKKIPNGTYLREVKDVPGAEGVKLISYIEQSNVEEQFNLGDIKTCPGSTLGQSIEGVYHLALYKDNQLYGTTKIPPHHGDYTPDDKLRLAYKNTKYYAYNYFSGDKFNKNNENDPVDVNLIQFGQFTPNENYVDFVITGPTLICGHTSYLHGGYDKIYDKIIFYSIIEDGQKYYWGDNFHPRRSGEVATESRCSDHGIDTSSSSYYKFESTSSAYILSKSEVHKCR